MPGMVHEFRMMSITARLTTATNFGVCKQVVMVMT